MKKIVLGLFLSAWIILAAGCIDHSTLISLERDGSGQIVQTTYMSAMAASMMAGMGGEAGVDPLVDEQQARAKAATFGEGVRFVSVSPVSKPDGSKGGRAVYAFDDINSLQVSMDQMDEDSVMSMESDEEEDAQFFTFEYTPGNLVIKRPAMDEEEGDVAMDVEPEGDDQAAMAEEMGKQMMEGMLPMLKGMRIQIAVEVPDAVRKTNASYVQSGSETDVARQIVLMDFDLDKLLEHPEGMDYLLKMQDDANFEKMAEQLGNAGIRVEAEETVTVEF